MNIATRLKLIKEELKKSTSELAVLLDIPARTVGSYERGENPPNSKFLTALSEILHINVNWFLTGEGSMFIEQPENDENTLAIKLKKGQVLKVEYED